MTHREMFADARWLCPEGSPDAALFRAEFTAEPKEKGSITICGLGYFILYINGERVGVDEFVPPYSDYHDRPEMHVIYPLNDEQAHRIYCMRYDITPYLCAGTNVLGVMVGGGFYHQTRRTAEGNMSYGGIKLCYRMEVGGREYLSGEDTLWQRGFFTSSNLFYGEVLDYTDFDRAWNTTAAKQDGWEKSRTVMPPKSEYYLTACPPDRVTECLVPKAVRDFGSFTVYDAGCNVSGYPVICCEKAGETVELECAENLNPDGTLNNRSVGWGEQRQCETFVTDSETQYHPIFTWFGFRYFTLTNNAKPVEVRVIHADVQVTSDFRCSDETLNWYYQAFLRTQLNNMHGGIPSDCPHRERLGYTGDGQLVCDAGMTMLDTRLFYRKWIQDIADCQDPYTGHVQHTAPFAGGGGGPAGWGGAMIVVPYTYYKHYGEKSVLRTMLPHMEKYAAYMESRCEDGLVVREEKDGWCLGDWCPPEQVQIPEPLVNTALYVSQLRMLCFCCKALGKDTQKYEDAAEAHLKALKKAYFADGEYADGVQGANAFLYNCGADSDLLLRQIVEKYTVRGEFDTGMFGTYILLDVLFRTGNGELAASLLANKKEVSFEAMRRAGATTIWENWNGEASHDHPMFGASSIYLFSGLLGIRQREKSVGYADVLIEPTIPENMDFAEGYITTPKGRIFVGWKRENGKVRIRVELWDRQAAEFRYHGFRTFLVDGESEFVF